MPDTHTRRQKLEAMAKQTVSPHEAEIARDKLSSLPPEPVRTFGGSYASASAQYEDFLSRIIKNQARWDAGWSTPRSSHRAKAARSFHKFKTGSGKACASCGLAFYIGSHYVEGLHERYEPPGDPGWEE